MGGGRAFVFVKDRKGPLLTNIFFCIKVETYFVFEATGYVLYCTVSTVQNVHEN